MNASDAAALGARAEQMIFELARISAEPKRLVRLYLSPEHRRAADLVADWMRKAGMAVSEDALGTVRGRWGAGPGRKQLLIGSHLDSVIDAGKYDGPLGVISGILVVDHLNRAGAQLPFGIDVLAFGDEEGSRFPSTLSTSAGCAGVFEMETLGLADSNGITYGDALAAYGKDVQKIATVPYKPSEVAGYVEVHIEQGPVLESAGEPLGVVTGIVGQHRMRVTVTGEAGHAGTVPMPMRRDALTGAAELVLAIEQFGRAHTDAGLVTTVGRITASPGAVNIIPGQVVFSFNIRCMDDALRRDVVAEVQAAAFRIVEERKLEVEFEPFHETEAVACAPAFQDALDATIRDLGHKPLRIPSGAGHDAQMMARLCPSAMMFVRCKGGISHNPAEYASPTDMGLAIAALIGFVERLKP